MGFFKLPKDPAKKIIKRGIALGTKKPPGLGGGGGNGIGKATSTAQVAKRARGVDKEIADQSQAMNRLGLGNRGGLNFRKTMVNKRPMKTGGPGQVQGGVTPKMSNNDPATRISVPPMMAAVKRRPPSKI